MTIITDMSDKGCEALVDEEGEVLRAYLCPAGVWTIGTGLTAASGVVKPKKGMVITQRESRRLLRLALERNYEPRVAKALPTEKQHVFDGATMFDWNTGAINRASWVKLFRGGQLARAEQSFKSWVRAAGRRMAGLVRRRGREWNIIAYANYGSVAGHRVTSISMFADHKADFARLGYDVSRPADIVVEAFQKDHGLTVDGLIGPATRASLKRALDARASKRSTGTAAGGGAVAGGGTEVATNPGAPDVASIDTLLYVLAGAAILAGLVYGGFLIWRYRGPLFAWLPEPIKDFAENNLGVVVGRRVRT